MATGVKHLGLFVQSLRGISLLERHILLTLLSIYRNRNPCALSVDRWASRLGVHRASMYRALSNLDGKYLERLTRPGRTSLFKPTSRLCAMVYGRDDRTKKSPLDNGPVRGLRSPGAYSSRPIPPERKAAVLRSLPAEKTTRDQNTGGANRPTGKLSELQRFILAIGEKVPRDDGGEL